MGIYLVWGAVSRPAGMSKAESFSLFGLIENRFKSGYPAACLLYLNNAVAQQGHACRVVTAIFEAFQTLDKDWLSCPLTQICHYAAHFFSLDCNSTVFPDNGLHSHRTETAGEARYSSISFADTIL
jgi:hypothetical protein